MMIPSDLFMLLQQQRYQEMLQQAEQARLPATLAGEVLATTNDPSSTASGELGAGLLS